MAVAVEISRRRESSSSLVTREREDCNLRMRDAEGTRSTTGVEVSPHTTTKRSDKSPLLLPALMWIQQYN